MKRKNKQEIFCTEQGEYVYCNKVCLNCEVYKESRGDYGKNYP